MPETDQKLGVTIVDQFVFTPFAGAALINEILKCLLYQKSQIPYPYAMLKQMVEKRRKRVESNESRSTKLNFTHENHYRVASSAYDHLDFVTRSIVKEFSESGNKVKGIAIVFGPSPNCPKEVFSVEISNMAEGHTERNHLGELNKHLQKVLRNLFLSQTWMDSVNTSIPCTNTYIYLKKQIDIGERNMTSEGFELSQPYSMATNTKHSVCYVNYEPTKRTNCCANLQVFEDGVASALQKVESYVMDDSEQTVWYRSKGLLKGFKDIFVNKVSVSELW